MRAGSSDRSGSFDAAASGQPESQAAERVVRILEVIADSPEPLTVAGIAEHLGLHRSIIYRFLRTLVRLRLVHLHPDGRYELGPGITALAQKAQADVPALIRPVLQTLSDCCEATAFVTELDENRTLCLMSVEPAVSRTHLIFRPGTVGPVDRGAPVIAIHAGRPATTDDYADARVAREQGYAWSSGTLTPGVESIACPIRLPPPIRPASVAVIFPVGSRVIKEVVREVQTAAHRTDEMFASKRLD